MSTPTMHLPARSRYVGPVREFGASALDHRDHVWAAPDPATVFSDPLAPLTAPARRPIRRAAAWPAPDAALRVDMAAPAAMTPKLLAPPPPNAVPISTVEPLHTLALPDLVALARTHAHAAPARVDAVRASVPSKPIAELRPPTRADLVMSDADAAMLAANRGAGRRHVSGKVLLAMGLGVAAFGAAVLALTTLV